MHNPDSADADSVDSFAAKNSISRRKVYDEISSGRLIAKKAGARTIITKEDGARWRRILPKLKPARCTA
jgi:hypothetical protein